jgi:hypothetical protein
MKTTKKAKQLPNRSALKGLDATARTINDYSKVTPITPVEPQPNILQGLRKPR